MLWWAFYLINHAIHSNLETPTCEICRHFYWSSTRQQVQDIDGSPLVISWALAQTSFLQHKRKVMHKLWKQLLNFVVAWFWIGTPQAIAAFILMMLHIRLRVRYGFPQCAADYRKRLKQHSVVFWYEWDENRAGFWFSDNVSHNK